MRSSRALALVGRDFVKRRVQFRVGHPGAFELGQSFLQELVQRGLVMDIEFDGLADLRRHTLRICSSRAGVAAHVAAAPIKALGCSPIHDLFGSIEGSISPSAPRRSTPR